ncbi:MAG: glycosyltransferase family 2 protein, partial [Bdellovibrionota bacterium]
MKVSIIIPVYNEASTVGTLLHRVSNQEIPGMTKELLVVESNSTDGTRRIVEEFAKTHPIRLILQDQPRGKGHAVRTGLAEADGEIILIQDGDLEYDVADYPALVQPIVEGRADFVLGSRHLAAGRWRIRKFEQDQFRAAILNFGGFFFHTFFNILYGQRLTDPTTMFKVFRRSCVQGMEFVSDRFDFDFEIVAKLIRSGYSPVEVPVSYSSRGFEEGKKIRVFRDPLTWVWAILRFRFARIG